MTEKTEKQSMVQRARAFLFGRQRAYLLTFNLQSQAVQEVLADLAKFCRAHETTFQADPRLHAVLEGRREVWLRIQNHLKLDSETLWKLTERRGTNG